MNDFAVIHLILRLFVLAVVCMLMAAPAQAWQWDHSRSEVRGSQIAGCAE